MIDNVTNNLNQTNRSSIRQSKRADLDAIHAWLTEEKAQGIHGNFLCNWSVIEGAHRNGNLLVYVDGKTGLPLSFQLGGLIYPGILQVRYSYRGRGIGRKMVERCITLAAKRDQYLLYIECKPSTSISFWQHMGFTLIKNTNGKNYAYRIIDKLLPFTDVGVATAVVIRFFPESRKWAPETEPYAVYAPQAKQAPDGTIYLAKRVQFHEKAVSDVRDVIVEIEVDGNYRFCDKAKYEEAHRVGVRRCTNGHYIDKIRFT